MPNPSMALEISSASSEYGLLMVAFILAEHSIMPLPAVSQQNTGGQRERLPTTVAVIAAHTPALGLS